MTDYLPAQWICAQLGAREHYAIPRVLHGQRKLCALFTDFWWRDDGALLTSVLKRSPAASLAGRYHPELADASVMGFNWSSINARLLASRKSGGLYESFITEGAGFSIRVARAIEALPDRASVFFSYDTTFLEAAESASGCGMKTVVCQMDPGPVEFAIVAEEYRNSADWVEGEFYVPEAYNDRRRQEWEAADVVVVNSGWSREALIAQGVPADKLVVIPLCYELPNAQPVARKLPSTDRKLKVLWLGQVNLRKGIRYLADAAAKLKGLPIEFHICGPLGVRESAVRKAPDNMIFHGRVERMQVEQFYQDADVFVLPTLSDGFALTQLEAMAHGVPVIATERCARVVTHGRDGLLVPPMDADALADAVLLMLENPGLRARMSQTAKESVKEYDSWALHENLNLLEKRLG